MLGGVGSHNCIHNHVWYRGLMLAVSCCDPQLLTMEVPRRFTQPQLNSVEPGQGCTIQWRPEKRGTLTQWTKGDDSCGAGAARA